MTRQEDFGRPEKPLEKTRKLITQLEYQRKPKCKENSIKIRSQ